MNHQEIGSKQELFISSGVISPGNYIFLPNGTRIYNKLLDFVKKEYYRRDYQEVITPILIKNKLWETSGHWEQYKENMFVLSVDNKEEVDYSICPMNCPKACWIFDLKPKSYKELPLRIADFGMLHRKELSGSLNGIFRTQKFSQDDSHSFCMESQIESEVESCLDFLDYVYNKFGFQYELELSTRPEKYMGELELWDKSEKQLENSLDKFTLQKNKTWKLNKFDGAFYGPKIDIHIKDSQGRSHQCGTIQLDFQLPVRFDLKYVCDKGEFKRPVIIHKAIYGSFERFIGIITEHYQTKWPLWINPNQIIILPISEKINDYAKKIFGLIKNKGYYIDIDDSDRKLDKKIREAQIIQYNYILVVGQKEMDSDNINVRYRDNTDKKILSIKELLKEIKENIKKFQ